MGCDLEEYQACINDLMGLLTQKIPVNLKEKMKYMHCINNVVEKCYGMKGEFAKNYGPKALNETCDKDGICKSDDESSSMTNNFGYLYCIDDTVQYYIGCASQALMKAFEIQENGQGSKTESVNCNLLRFCLHCVEEVTLEKCGEKAQKFIRTHFEDMLQLKKVLCPQASVEIQVKNLS